MSTEENTMHRDFANWMLPVNIDLDRDSLKLRWQTVSRLVHKEKVEIDKIDDLIRFIFGKTLPNTRLEWLQTEFKNEDSFFLNDANKNQQELLALASSIIALIIEGRDDLASLTGGNVLAAYCCLLRPPAYGSYLIEKAQDAVSAHAIQIRERKKPTKAAAVVRMTTDEQVSSPPDEAIKHLIPFINKTADTLNKANENILALENHMKLKDEELEILWWVIVGYSDMLDTPLTSIHNVLQPIICGIELAKHITLKSEPPALRGILSKCLPESKQKISFKTLAKHLDNHTSIILDSLPNEPCSVLTPTHYLVKCIQDIGEHWQQKWSQDTQLKPEMEMTSIDLAVQLCREHLQLINREF